MLNVLLGRTPKGVTHAEAIAVATDRLSELSLLAQARGIHLVIEALNPIDHPGYLVSDVLEAARVVDNVGNPWVGLLFDAYHVAMSGDVPSQRLAEVAHIVSHVQIADAPGRQQPGTGKIDYHALFAQLVARRFGGRVGLEYAPSGATDDSFGWLENYPSTLADEAGRA